MTEMPRVVDMEGMGEKRRVCCSGIEVCQRMEGLSTAVLELEKGETPPEDGEMVEIFSSSGSLGIFCVEGTETVLDKGGAASCRVSLTHGLSLLGRQVLPGYTELGGEGMTIGECIAFLLQGNPYFTPGFCDFSTCFSYAFENENLLTAIMSLARPLSEESMFVCDFSVFPWRLSLMRLNGEADCEVRLERNCSGMQITADTSGVVTKLYPLGYGEGADQLTISRVNGGKAYLLSPNASVWGVRESVLTMGDVTDDATLMAAGESALRQLDSPRLTVTAECSDFHSLTRSAYDAIEPGKMCRCILPKGEVRLRIRKAEWRDLVKAPQLVEVTMGKEAESAESLLREVSRKSRISQLYSQGAASEYAVQCMDNCDSTHPARLRFYIDRDAIHINSVNVNFTIAPFRAYSRATSSGGGGTVTSKGGGSTSLTVNPMRVPVQGDSASGYVAVPGHTHVLADHTHTVAVTAHTHGIAYGIYEDSTYPDSVAVKVDGNPVPASAITRGRLDAAPYLACDSQGKIRRGAWHTVEFLPASLARIEANLQLRSFIRSTTGAGK